MIGFRLIYISFFCFLLNSIAAQKQDYIAFDDKVSYCYQQIIELDFLEAKKTLSGLSIPRKNKIRILLENYNDFFKLFIHENRSYYDKVKPQKNIRLEQIQNSTLTQEWKNYLQAEIHLQWALVHLKMEDNFLAFQSIRQALSLLESNQKEYPEFKYTYKSLGILHALVSTIPEGFTWAAKIIGLRGTLQEGIKELDLFLQFAESENPLFIQEAIAAKSFLMAYLENKPNEAYQYLSNKIVVLDPNPLMTFIHSRIAMKAGYNDATINIISSLPPSSRQKLPFLSYLHGVAALQKLDLKAEQYFLQYLKDFKGNSYIKEAYQKLSWCALMNKQNLNYERYKQLCLTKGNTLTDEDQQALKEAQKNELPNLFLLKARLLSDGNYPKEAERLLLENEKVILAESTYLLEYYYRLGRVYQLLKVKDKAKLNFNLVVDQDLTQKSFMSANALLQCGYIYESEQNHSMAKKYFKSVLERNPDQYSRSLHQKAKAGLVRIK